MEPEDRGRSSRLNVKGFFKSLRNRRSKSRTSEASANSNLANTPQASASKAPETKAPETEAPQPPDVDRQKAHKVDDEAILNNFRLEQAAETREDDTISVEEHRAALWRAAFEELRRENEKLVGISQTVLREQSSIPNDEKETLTEQLAAVAKAQRQRVDNRQWQFQWFGRTQSVRETIERILNITQRSTSLVSIDINQAPPYVSIPWSAITALIPLMMNEFKEHKGCKDGLETVTRLTFSYQMAENTFLGSSDTRDLYKKVVIHLYKKILECQALAIRYFGRTTLQRLGINVGTAFRILRT